MLLAALLSTWPSLVASRAQEFDLPPFRVTWDNSTLSLSAFHSIAPTVPVFSTVPPRNATPMAFLSIGYAEDFRALDSRHSYNAPVTSDGGYNCGWEDSDPLKKCEKMSWQTSQQLAPSAQLLPGDGTTPPTLLITGEVFGGTTTESWRYNVTLVPTLTDSGSEAKDAHLVLAASIDRTPSPAGVGAAPAPAPMRGMFGRRRAPSPSPRGNSSLAPNRIFLTYASRAGESALGFGNQYSRWDQAGAALPLLSTEQGIGRGLPVLTSVVNDFGGETGGHWWTSYAPAPLYIGVSPAPGPAPTPPPSPPGPSSRGGDPVEDISASGSAVANGMLYRALLADTTSFTTFDMTEAPSSLSRDADGAATSVAPGLVRIESWLPRAPQPAQLALRIFSPTVAVPDDSNNAPLSLLRQLSNVTGRMQALPDWVGQGAVLGAEGAVGENATATVLNLTTLLQDAGVPLAAVWLQDWTGVRDTPNGARLWWNWELDSAQYANWGEMVSRLHGRGVRTLTYINPFLVNASDKPGHRRNLLQEASDRGYLVQKLVNSSSGATEDYILPSGDFNFGTVDLSSPAARSWYRDVIVDNMLAPASSLGGGVSGWMHDFGEYLPFDAQLASGEDPVTFHNLFTERWSELGRAAIDEARRRRGMAIQHRGNVEHEQNHAQDLVQGAEVLDSLDDVVFFARSGWTRSPSHASLFWMGDQLTSWDSMDGLRTALLGTLSSSLSGRTLSHSDIGGYTEVDRQVLKRSLPFVTYLRDRELLQRWMELSAFSDVMFRTHPGLLPDASAQVWSTNASIAAFARMARVHVALGPYRKQLMQQAQASGAPLARPLFLQFPTDSGSVAVCDQFMLGSELLVAPMLDTTDGKASAARRDVYFPPLSSNMGRWVHLWSGATVNASALNISRYGSVDAPEGCPPAFYREKSVVGAALAQAIVTAVGTAPCK